MAPTAMRDMRSRADERIHGGLVPACQSLPILDSRPSIGGASFVVARWDGSVKSRNFPAAALNTLNARWWKLWLARLFGVTSVGRCDVTGREITTSVWRGKTYIVDVGPTNAATES